MREVQKVCGTCRWSKPYKLDWMCYNQESDYYCCFCGYDDSCEDWEGHGE